MARKCLAEPPGEKRIVAEVGHQTGLDGSLLSYTEGPIIFPLDTMSKYKASQWEVSVLRQWQGIPHPVSAVSSFAPQRPRKCSGATQGPMELSLRTSV